MRSDTEVTTMLRDISKRISTKTADKLGMTGPSANGVHKPTPSQGPGAVAEPISEPGQAGAERKPYKREIVWFNAIGFLLLHLGMVYGLYLVLSYQAKILTSVWAFVCGVLAAESVLLGAHRLYTHRSYKATLPLRLLIVWWQTVSSQNCLWVWVRDHRQHHKYSDTNADPHNATRGFFFSHIGWLMVRKHPDVFEAGRKVDMSDIEADPLVMFQKKYYNSLYFLLAILFPVAVPVYGWGETWWNSFFVSFMLRTFASLNIAWTVNSWAHLYGTHPFNKDIMPSESRLVSFFTFGEGWHNFHHTFPWDYRAAEFGQNLNMTCSIIEMFERWGWAYDLKCAPDELVRKRVLRSGDGTHPRYNKDGVPEHLVAESEPGEHDDEDDDDVEVLKVETKTPEAEPARAGPSAGLTARTDRSEERRG